MQMFYVEVFMFASNDIREFQNSNNVKKKKKGVM